MATWAERAEARKNKTAIEEKEYQMVKGVLRALTGTSLTRSKLLERLKIDSGRPGSKKEDEELNVACEEYRIFIEVMDRLRGFRGRYLHRDQIRIEVTPERGEGLEFNYRRIKRERNNQNGRKK